MIYSIAIRGGGVVALGRLTSCRSPAPAHQSAIPTRRLTYWAVPCIKIKDDLPAGVVGMAVGPGLGQGLRRRLDAGANEMDPQPVLGPGGFEVIGDEPGGVPNRSDAGWGTELLRVMGSRCEAAGKLESFSTGMFLGMR